MLLSEVKETQFRIAYEFDKEAISLLHRILTQYEPSSLTNEANRMLGACFMRITLLVKFKYIKKSDYLKFRKEIFKEL
jgi:hypothetical protein